MSTATKVVAKKTKESADGARAAVAKTSPPPAPLASSPAPPPTGKRMPAIYIDVQVHISPDTSPEQIDRIFASMAKHLGGFVG